MDDDLEYFNWLVSNRSKNQQGSLRLYSVIQNHRETIYSDKRNRRLCQTLLGINFSLWRAVFLANIKIDSTSMMTQAEKFLKKLIESNMIAFVHDFDNNHWTYRYYLVNARGRLKYLETSTTPLLEEGRVRPASEMVGKPLVWWEDLQEAFEIAVDTFEKKVSDEERDAN